MQIIFLGTSSMVPTKERNHSSILLSYGSENILADCGEGTQRQLKIAGIKLAKITKILISHWHGDHVLGLPGLIQSMSSSGFNKTLNIYGPKGTKKLIERMFEVFSFDQKFEIKVNEVNSGKFFEDDDFILEAEQLEHNIETLGYRLEEKDKRKINLNHVKKLGVPDGPLLGRLQEGKSITWKGKKILIVGASMGNVGTALAQYNLKQIFSYLDANVLGQPEFYVSMAQNKFDEKGNLIDESTKEHIVKAIKALLEK